MFRKDLVRSPARSAPHGTDVVRPLTASDVHHSTGSGTGAGSLIGTCASSRPAFRNVHKNKVSIESPTHSFLTSHPNSDGGLGAVAADCATHSPVTSDGDRFESRVAPSDTDGGETCRDA